MKFMSAVSALVALTMMIVGFQNCAQTNFGAVPASSEEPQDMTPPPIQQDVPPKDLQMRLFTPECPSNWDCIATFTLVEASTAELRFKWQTNDSKWQENQPNHYAVPDTNYIPAEGELVFAPGETSKSIYIKSLAFDNSLRIPFLWLDCKKDGVLSPCPVLVP